MKIQLLFFGITTDLVGESALTFSLEKKTTIKELKSLLKQKYEGLKNINDFAIAINETYAEDDEILKDTDVVAIIPPVSGG